MPSRFSSFASLLSPVDVIGHLTIRTDDHHGTGNLVLPPQLSPTRGTNSLNGGLKLGLCVHYSGQLCDLSLVTKRAVESTHQFSLNLIL